MVENSIGNRNCMRGCGVARNCVGSRGSNKWVIRQSRGRGRLCRMFSEMRQNLICLLKETMACYCSIGSAPCPRWIMADRALSSEWIRMFEARWEVDRHTAADYSLEVRSKLLFEAIGRTFDGHRMLLVRFVVTVNRTHTKDGNDNWEGIGEWAYNTVLSASMTPGGLWTSCPAYSRFKVHQQRCSGAAPIWATWPRGVHVTRTREKRGRGGLPGRVTRIVIERSYEVPLFSTDEVRLHSMTSSGLIKSAEG